MRTIDAERHPAPRGRGEAVMDRAEIACYHGEQIARLRERIVPDGKMLVVGEHTAFDEFPFESSTGARVLSACMRT